MLRVDEIYLSVQGEGPQVGKPTIFVRFGGCNLRCPGWPCDTLHAVLPENRFNWLRLDPYDVYLRIIDIAKGQTGGVNICFTGGEPFLQPNDDLHVLFTYLKNDSLIGNVECFSNGTIAYPAWALDIEGIDFVMDWKLPGSGEDPLNETRLTNLKELGYRDSVKFTIADKEDLDVAIELYDRYVKTYFMGTVFYGIAWDKLTNADLIAEVLEKGLPWRFNMQIHNHVWDRSLRGI